MALREVTLDNGVKCRVTDNGEVYSLDHTSIRKNGRADNRKGKCLKPKIDRYGYKVVTLTNKENRKSIPVHRLVALAYLPNPDGKKEINHIDGNKLNNNVENLEWSTAKENQLHKWKTGLAYTKRDSHGRFLRKEG